MAAVQPGFGCMMCCPDSSGIQRIDAVSTSKRLLLIHSTTTVSTCCVIVRLGLAVLESFPEGSFCPLWPKIWGLVSLLRPIRSLLTYQLHKDFYTLNKKIKIKKLN